MSVLGSLSPSLRGAVVALLRHRFALVALAAFMMAGTVILHDYGISIDGPNQRYVGIANIAYALGDVGLLPDYHNKFYGASYEAPLVLVERALRLEDSRDIYLARRLMTHLFFLIGGLFAYLLAFRLFASRPLSMFALLLFLLHPRIYTAFIYSIDLPFLTMFMITLFFMHRTFNRDTLQSFVLLGVSAGVLTNIRIMGVVLLAGVLGMQALRFFFASMSSERKRALLNSGVFALTASLVAYALLPYLWADPAPRIVEYWTTLSQHPQDLRELFRGQEISTQDPPANYIPTWFAITTHPFALLLGWIGMFALLHRGATLRAEALHDSKLRLGLILVWAFALPFLAIALLSPTVYGGWRQMFFLWAPFSLLATFGVQWLLQSLPQAHFRASVYGALGAGLVTTIVAMALLHPFQNYHFNFFVDRVASEDINMQYRTNSSRGIYTAIKQLLDLQPSSQIIVKHSIGVGMNRLVLPELERNRLITAHRTLAKFSIDRAWNAPNGNALYTAKAYNNALWIVTRRNPDGNPYAATYEEAISQEPFARSEYDIYINRDGYSLVYVKEPCVSPVLRDRFFLLIFPENADDLSETERSLGRANRSFAFYDYGSAFDSKCVVEVPLPDYDVSAIRTGQLRTAEGDPRWEAAFPYQPPAVYRAAYASAADAEPDIRAAFNVYLSEDKRSLAYLREPCVSSDVERPFFIHVIPERESDLPDERKVHGFDNWGFDFLLHGIVFDGKCVAEAPLPDYPIERLRTGQFTRGEGEIWDATLTFAQ